MVQFDFGELKIFEPHVANISQMMGELSMPDGHPNRESIHEMS
jgi:hypothetical protein